MNVREALREGTRLLWEAGSDEAELEAHLLLRHVLGVDRAHLYQSLNEALGLRAQNAYRRAIERRLAGEPAPYITRRKEFFGRQFEVSPAAIIPRPETETLIELAVDFARKRFSDRPIAAVDVGVGCGAIAVTLALELSQARLTAVDISKRALALARRNAQRHGVAGRITFLHGDLLSPVTAPADIIVANLPYVTTPDWETLPPEIREHEPRRGLDGGLDGLRLIRRLLRQAPARIKPGGALFLEIGDEQGEAARRHARAAFPGGRVDVCRDLAGFDRVVAILT
jgi:release factor glutamine methyltransferase